MKFLKKLNESIQIAILTYFVTIVGLIALLFLFFIGHMDIPLGLLLGGGIVGTLNLFAGLIQEWTSNKEGAIVSIIFTIIRNIIIVASMIIIALMYYRWNMPYFNIFAFVGTYTVSIIITLIVHLKERK